MSQPVKKIDNSSSTGGKLGSPASVKSRRRIWAALLIVAGVISVIAALVGFFYYQQYVAPFRRTIITVDDTSINMDYFLRRASQAGASPLGMLETLTNEQLIKLGASRYGVEASPEDIDQQLRQIAGGQSGNITEAEFKEWYRQQLNQTRLSDAEYREMIAANLLAIRLHDYLVPRVPTIVEQVHLYGIITETEESATEIKTRLQAGEKFTDLAQELSLDRQTGENGGEFGWVPRGVMAYGFEDVAFRLGAGEVSEPLPTDQGYFLLMVAERADARELDENFRQLLEDKVLDVWLTEEKGRHDIKYNFNSEINAWLNWQLTKNKNSTANSQTGSEQG